MSTLIGSESQKALPEAGMQTTVSGHQYPLTPSIKRFVLEHVRDPLERIWDKDGSQLEIHLSDLHGPKGGLDRECRVIFRMAAGPKFVITEVTDDMRASIHNAGKRLLRRARKYRSQRTDVARRHRKHFIADMSSKELLTRLPRARSVPHAHEVRG